MVCAVCLLRRQGRSPAYLLESLTDDPPPPPPPFPTPRRTTPRSLSATAGSRQGCCLVATRALPPRVSVRRVPRDDRAQAPRLPDLLAASTRIRGGRFRRDIRQLPGARAGGCRRRCSRRWARQWARPRARSRARSLKCRPVSVHAWSCAALAKP
ncbi:hypothetical protein T492DRAFT_977172 [Pavlovales sp. CCMP2436]|nr:hypothetical protein T492DRAFT_977172 [Pavlovales sp. CCMP2436]